MPNSFRKRYALLLRSLREEQGDEAAMATRQAFQRALQALQSKGWKNAPPFKTEGFTGYRFSYPLSADYLLILDVQTFFNDEKPVRRVLTLRRIARAG